MRWYFWLEGDEESVQARRRFRAGLTSSSDISVFFTYFEVFGNHRNFYVHAQIKTNVDLKLALLIYTVLNYPT